MYSVVSSKEAGKQSQAPRSNAEKKEEEDADGMDLEVKEQPDEYALFILSPQTSFNAFFQLFFAETHTRLSLPERPSST